jgi:hypothetical protein
VLHLKGFSGFLNASLSTRSIVKKNRRKPQTSQDKAVATNYHSHQASGENQIREYFPVFWAIKFNASCLEKFKNIPESFRGPGLQNERRFGRGRS